MVALQARHATTPAITTSLLFLQIRFIYILVYKYIHLNVFVYSIHMFNMYKETIAHTHMYLYAFWVSALTLVFVTLCIHLAYARKMHFVVHMCMCVHNKLELRPCIIYLFKTRANLCRNTNRIIMHLTFDNAMMTIDGRFSAYCERVVDAVVQRESQVKSVLFSRSTPRMFAAAEMIIQRVLCIDQLYTSHVICIAA